MLGRLLQSCLPLSSVLDELTSLFVRLLCFALFFCFSARSSAFSSVLCSRLSSALALLSRRVPPLLFPRLSLCPRSAPPTKKKRGRGKKHTLRPVTAFPSLSSLPPCSCLHSPLFPSRMFLPLVDCISLLFLAVWAVFPLSSFYHVDAFFFSFAHPALLVVANLKEKKKERGGGNPLVVLLWSLPSAPLLISPPVSSTSGTNPFSPTAPSFFFGETPFSAHCEFTTDHAVYILCLGCLRLSPWRKMLN